MNQFTKFIAYFTCISTKVKCVRQTNHRRLTETKVYPESSLRYGGKTRIPEVKGMVTPLVTLLIIYIIIPSVITGP